MPSSRRGLPIGFTIIMVQTQRTSSKYVTQDDEVRGGEPVVRGTRVPVYLLAELAEQGAAREELLEDYPAVTRESLEAALIYTRTHPRRGRKPRTPPWRIAGPA